jgi:hypothetical protein
VLVVQPPARVGEHVLEHAAVRAGHVDEQGADGPVRAHPGCIGVPARALRPESV